MDAPILWHSEVCIVVPGSAFSFSIILTAMILVLKFVLTVEYLQLLDVQCPHNKFYVMSFMFLLSKV